MEDFTQSEYLNDLYGGNYTFSAEPNPPSHEFALDQSLLGPHRFCSLGFEPLNFNTGNFFLQTQDLRLADLGGSALEIIRTYNSQSAETDGPSARSGRRNTASICACLTTERRLPPRGRQRDHLLHPAGRNVYQQLHGIRKPGL